MRKTLTATALAFLALATDLAAAEPDEPRTISTSGKAELRVAPDEVVLRLGVETFDEDIEKAKKANDERVSAVIRAARRVGVPDKQLKTDYFEIFPNIETHRKPPAGYTARKSITITLREVPRFEKLLTAVLEAGASHVHQIDFRTTELRKHRDRARALAVQAAKEKAEAMAGVLGETIGRPRSIQENSNNWWSWYGSSWYSSWSMSPVQNVVQSVSSGSASRSGGPTLPGQITVDAEVEVVFELADT